MMSLRDLSIRLPQIIGYVKCFGSNALRLMITNCLKITSKYEKS